MRVAATGTRAWAHVMSGERDEGRPLLDELTRMSEQGNSQAQFETARVPCSGHIHRTQKPNRHICSGSSPGRTLTA